jgi:hypothetical protein
LIVWNKTPPIENIHTETTLGGWLLILKLVIFVIPLWLAWKYAVTAYQTGWYDHERFMYVKTKLEELKKMRPSDEKGAMPVQHDILEKKTRLTNLPDDLKEHLEERLDKFRDI